MLLRYQERFHLSYEQVVNEPWEAIERAHFVWSLEEERANLEAKRQEFKSRR